MPHGYERATCGRLRGGDMCHTDEGGGQVYLRCMFAGCHMAALLGEGESSWRGNSGGPSQDRRMARGSPGLGPHHH